MKNQIQRLGDYMQKVQDLIDEHGWIVQTVGTNPAYSYTCGLTAKGLPELVAMGLPMEVAQTTLNALARKLINKEITLSEDQLCNEVFEGFPAKFRKLKHEDVVKYLRIAYIVAPADTAPEAWQMLWPDPNGKFEGDPGVQEKYVAMQNLAFTETDEEHDS